jgi:hypothetical protein
MRRIILLLFIVFVSSASISAQEDPWVGEWTSEVFSDVDWEASNATKDSKGTIQTVINTEYRTIIRITKNGDQYTVRGKTIKVNDPNYTKYHSQYSITKVEDNNMWLQSFTSKEPFRSNGKIDEYCDITRYYKLTLENGGLHYVFYHLRSVNYDSNMRYRDTDNYDYSTWKNHDIMMYNDNW